MTSSDIREWRKRLRISEAEAAKRLELPLKTFQRLESGRQRPHPEMEEKLRRKMVDYSGRRSAKVPEL